MSHNFHKFWLKVTAVVVGSFGPVFFLGTMMPTAEPRPPYTRHYKLALGWDSNLRFARYAVSLCFNGWLSVGMGSDDLVSLELGL